MLPSETLAMAERVLGQFRARGWKLATAESCTGGLVAAALTHVPGSSDVFDRGFVSYANGAKADMLHVPAALILSQGAVSRDVAAVMAEGALAVSRAQAALSVTGIAGPTGGSAEKPVGLVWLGLACVGTPVVTERHVFAGDRTEIRAQAVRAALTLLESIGRLDDPGG
jgi:nicotinamide-nucleotide amidase